MNTSEIQDKLNKNGFPCKVDGDYGPKTTEAVKRFQEAYCGPNGWLYVDGKVGPATQKALEFLPRLSTHFTVAEVGCKHCGYAYVKRELLSALEDLRDTINRPLFLLGCYRCEAHNKAVGGVGGSQHLVGKAADLSTAVSIATARSVGRFTGIGTRGNLASHVDVRSGSPVTWRY